MDFVHIDGLRINYGKFQAVINLSLNIPKGEVFGFIGPNGAGKTSTIRALATLLKPSAGLIFINGIDVLTSPSKIRGIIGYMPDSFGTYDDITVNEYLHFFAAAYMIDREKREGTIRDVLELTDLSAKQHDLVNALSRGMKQRLGLARILLHDPEFLLLDEPASGLDPRARIEMRELLKELKKMGKTILISSHILPELSELCTRIGIIEQGKLVAEGSIKEIYNKLGIMRKIQIQIMNLDDTMIEKIKNIAGVNEIITDIDRITLKINENILAIENLSGIIHGFGAKVRMFHPEAMDMESAFMRLTEGKVS